jgi:hypothetical protein
VHGVAGQRLAVLPALPEHRLDVADHRPAQRDHHVVPRRPRPVHRGHRLALRIAAVVGVVAAAVAEVDPADERDVELGPAGVPQHDELLVVRSAGAHPHVQQHLAAGPLDPLAEVLVLLGTERQPVPVRAPDQPAHVHPALGRRAEQVAIVVSSSAVSRSSGSPRQSVNSSRSPRRSAPTQRASSAKVDCAVHKRLRTVAGRVRTATGVAGVEPGARVAPLGSGQEPFGLDGAPPSEGPTVLEPDRGGTVPGRPP